MSKDKKTNAIETIGTNQPLVNRDGKGRFLPGNAGGPGGPRPGSGRKPKPGDPSLLERLYETLDESAPTALSVLDDALRSADEKIRVKAADLILKKVLPDQSMIDLQRRESDAGLSVEDISDEQRALLEEVAKLYIEAQRRRVLEAIPVKSIHEDQA